MRKQEVRRQRERWKPPVIQCYSVLGLSFCRNLVCSPERGPGPSEVFNSEGSGPQPARLRRLHGSGELGMSLTGFLLSGGGEGMMFAFSLLPPFLLSQQGFCLSIT